MASSMPLPLTIPYKADTAPLVDSGRVTAMVDFVRTHTAADVFAAVLPPSAAAAAEVLARHGRFAHGALLLFPERHDALPSFLGTLDVVVGERVPSTVVRDRLAGRLDVAPGDLDVSIVRCSMPGLDGHRREVELFVLEAQAGERFEQLVASERLHWHETHFAFELEACDDVVLRGVRDLLIGPGGMSPDGGGYNEHEDVSVLYFAAPGVTPQGWPRRLELTVTGHHPEILEAHGAGPGHDPDQPVRDLLRLMTGAWATQAVCVLAELGVVDHIRDGVTSAAELAVVTRTEPDNLNRLLRYVVNQGVLALDERGSYSLTDAGALLGTGVDGSLRDLARLYGGLFFRSYEALGHTVRTGESAFVHVYGEGPFDYFARHPQDARLFERAMAAGSRFHAAVPAALDLSTAHVVVDVAGADGRLLAEVLRAAPAARGVLFDRPHVIDAAHDVLRDLGCADRCELVAGDFFRDPVPAGGDIYLLSRILHDWDDRTCAVILKNIRAAIAPGGELAIVERPIPDPGLSSLALAYDVHMMVNNANGRERTVDEYRALLAAAGFELHDRRSLPLDMAVLIARAV